MEFEWDPAKAASNLAKHGISFPDAASLFGGPVVRRRSDRDGEERYVAVGVGSGRVIAVIYTPRGDRIRIISARRARTDEEREYRTLYG